MSPLAAPYKTQSFTVEEARVAMVKTIVQQYIPVDMVTMKDVTKVELQIVEYTKHLSLPQ